MSRSLWIALALVCCLALPGCDGGGETDTDGGGGSDCTGMPDGTSCGTGLVCAAGACIAGGSCGDRVVDPGEDCDDGNMMAFDGCEPGTCTFTCAEDFTCNDGIVCNGAETCVGNLCVSGDPPTDGRMCMQDGGTDGVCRSGACVDAGCGNMVMDAGEECDDGNEVNGDGCDVDCSFSCNADADCDDNDVCTGAETCDVPTHACVAGTALECTDGSDCTMDVCDAVMGCGFPLIDTDMDGHAATSLGACGTDCDDSRDDVNPDTAELCDAIDHDCDGDAMPADTPFWYLDCDGDGFAASGAASLQRCMEPPPQACGGGWTTRPPGDPSTIDCNDSDADARPTQSLWFTTAASGGGYEYNCRDGDERRYTTAGVSETAFCLNFTFCTGSAGWSSSTAPACGSSGRYTYCSTLRGSCGRRVETARVQSCH